MAAYIFLSFFAAGGTSTWARGEACKAVNNPLGFNRCCLILKVLKIRSGCVQYTGKTWDPTLSAYSCNVHAFADLTTRYRWSRDTIHVNLGWKDPRIISSYKRQNNPSLASSHKIYSWVNDFTIVSSIMRGKWWVSMVSHRVATWVLVTNLDILRQAVCNVLERSLLRWRICNDQ